MCIIIDANLAADICDPNDPFSGALHKWIIGGGKVAIGGKLFFELSRLAEMRSLLSVWSAAGRLVSFPNDVVDGMANDIAHRCKSDDSHVVALAIISKSGVVVTNDHGLMADLKNKNLVEERRRIYKPIKGPPKSAQFYRGRLSAAKCT